ncbi:unnamed protein product, partial [Ectocarpus sp. 12 AP-2014]
VVVEVEDYLLSSSGRVTVTRNRSPEGWEGGRAKIGRGGVKTRWGTHTRAACRILGRIIIMATIINIVCIILTDAAERSRLIVVAIIVVTIPCIIFPDAPGRCSPFFFVCDLCRRQITTSAKNNRGATAPLDRDRWTKQPPTPCVSRQPTAPARLRVRACLYLADEGRRKHR